MYDPDFHDAYHLFPLELTHLSAYGVRGRAADPNAMVESVAITL